MDGPTPLITTTWRLPEAPLRSSAVATKLVALLMVAALATAARTGLPLSAFYAPKAATAFAALMLLSLGFLQRHHPFARFGPANQVTTVRAILVALIVGLVGELPLPVLAASAVAVSIVVTMLDGVDGWLARRHAIASDFGARFDMEVDALLILTLSLLAWRFGKAGAWVVAAGAMRYAFVAAGARWRWLQAPLPPLAAGAVVASLVATMLDGVDGWLARRQQIVSDYGARFDMEVDALLIMVLSILAWRFGKAGVWVIASGAMRYLFVAAGLRWRWLRAPLRASRRRQTVCVVQVAELTVALVPWVTPPVSTAIAMAALAALTTSFLVDTLWLWRRAA